MVSESEAIQEVMNMLFNLRHSWVPQDVETTYRHTRKVKALEFVIKQAERADRLKVRCTEIAAESSAVENRLWKRINEYESTLIFYADEENYKQYSDSFSDSGLSESKVSADGGYKARQAMRRK